jgi:hypothetical protein
MNQPATLSTANSVSVGSANNKKVVGSANNIINMIMQLKIMVGVTVHYSESIISERTAKNK